MIRSDLAKLGCAASALVLTACAAPDYHVIEAGDALTPPRQAESISEQMQRDQQDGGCLTAGNLGREDCQDRWGDVLAPEPPPMTPVPPPDD